MTGYPAFYQPEKVGLLYRPDVVAAVTSGQQAGLTPAEDDQKRIILLLVDSQVDFVHEDGSLSVPGAVADARRVIEWIFDHAGQITAIASSLDSHIPTQIFYPTWWVDDQGNHPDAFTTITSEDVDGGRWQPVFEKQWSEAYVHKLEEQAKKALMIWPYHTMIGTPGHSITPALYEAIAYHAAARKSRATFLDKGRIPKTEHYSLLEPEVKVPTHPQGTLNTSFLDMLASYDLIYVAGQAKSHCVLETVTSVMRHFEGQPDELAKWRVLMDCTSAVAHPEIDFDAMADEQYAEYAERGLKLAKSTDPVG